MNFELKKMRLWTLPKKLHKQEGFLPCQTPTSTLRLKVGGCSVKNWGSKNKSEELAIGVLDLE